MKRTSIEFTEQEAAQLIKLLNIAVKQVGIEDGGETAGNAVYFLTKVNQAFSESASQQIQQTSKNGKDTVKV